MQLRHAVLRLIALQTVLAGICYADEGRGYLFVSSVHDQAVYYSKLLDSVDLADGKKQTKELLASSGQVSEPRGLAVDHIRKILFAMDTGKQALLGMRLNVKGNSVTIEDPVEVVKGTAGHWVTVDTGGTVFFSDKGKIWSLPPHEVHNVMEGNRDPLDSTAFATVPVPVPAPAPPADEASGDSAAADSEDAATGDTATSDASTADASTSDTSTADTATSDTASADTSQAATNFMQVRSQSDASQSDASQSGGALGSDADVNYPLYDSDQTMELNTPQGLAADGHLLFWLNGANGKTDGVLIRGLEAPPLNNPNQGVTKLATNADVGSGLCLTPSRIFYTDSAKSVYTTKLVGGGAVTVTDQLQKSQACVYDGDGTIFVADQDGNKVFSFPGGGPAGGARAVTPVLDVPSAFGLAVLPGGSFRAQPLGLATLVVIVCSWLTFMAY